MECVQYWIAIYKLIEIFAISKWHTYIIMYIHLYLGLSHIILYYSNCQSTFLALLTHSAWSSQGLISTAKLARTQRQRDHTCACGELNFILLDILYCSLCPSIYSGRLMIFQWLNTRTNYAQCFVRVPP